MKLRMYWCYATRSLMRGGQRSLLAIFCVAVGVMAIVGLQLVSDAATSSLLGDVRAINGGDVALDVSNTTLLTPADLTYFDQLKSQGAITAYAAIDMQQAQAREHGGPLTQRMSVSAINPSGFPLEGAPTFMNPSAATLSSTLRGNTVVITTTLAQILNLRVGDSTRISVQDGRSANVTVGGIIESAGQFQGSLLLINIQAYATIPSSTSRPIGYSNVYVDVPGHSDANAAAFEHLAQQRFPLADVQTTKQLVSDYQQQVDAIRYFLQIVGLLALLIGGVGIMNTMQVLLHRRRVEIATLKTAGYRRRDLYALFGLETGLVGLAGGIIGTAAGVGVSFLVKGLLETTFSITLPTTIHAATLAAGVTVGVVTALIFGLLPIAKSSLVRPLAILRELPEGASIKRRLLTLLLTALVLVLFFGLALGILQNVVVAALIVGGTTVFLALLGLFFGLVVWLISKLPIPESLGWRYVLLPAGALLVGVALAVALPSFGILLLVAALMGIVVVFVPRTWKANAKLALRNIGRQKTRTVATLLALYIGVFAIGLVLTLGLDIKTGVNQYFSQSTNFDAAIIASYTDKAVVDRELARTSGITYRSVTTLSQAAPVAINGQPIGDFVHSATAGGQYVASDIVRDLTRAQGYDLASSQAPDTTIIALAQGAHDTRIGRTLNAGDAGTANILLPVDASKAPDNLKLNDTIVLSSQDAKAQTTVTIVGFYTVKAKRLFGAVLADTSIVSLLADGHPSYVYTLNLDPKIAETKLAAVQAAVPAVQIYTLADLLAQVSDIINNLITLLVTIASLAMLASVIIIANAVALAMLERRRELGILKAVGHTSRSVLSEVLMESAVVGFTGAVLAMAVVSVAVPLLGTAFFQRTFQVDAPIVLGVVFATCTVSMVVTALTAQRATRVRPLAVLRYE